MHVPKSQLVPKFLHTDFDLYDIVQSDGSPIPATGASSFKVVVQDPKCGAVVT